MAIKTIGVTVKGKEDVERLTKLINGLKKSVSEAQKEIMKLGGSEKNPSFTFKIKIDDSDFIKGIQNIKSVLDKTDLTPNIDIKKFTDSTLQMSKSLDDFSKNSLKSFKEADRASKNVGDNFDNIISKSSKANGNIKTFTDYVVALDQISEALDNVSSRLTVFIQKTSSVGAVSPFKALLSSFREINKSIIDMNLNIGKMFGSTFVSGIRNAFNSASVYARQGIGSIAEETKNLGDAMEVYRVNMEAFGLSSAEVNKRMKNLGDYGKKSVYDTGDLLNQSASYTAYGRADADELTKAVAGLVAQTRNPKENLKEVGIQLSQMMAAGKLNQQDFRIMRERFSSLGASAVNDALLQVAKSKGYESIIDATREGGITSNEVLNAIKSIGFSDGGDNNKFQKLVNSIITPSQAIGNLKETLANLAVYDQFDDKGNVTDGALKNVYDSTTRFIKGLTNIVGSNTFAKYLKSLGDSIGKSIDNVNRFGKQWNLTFGSNFLNSINKLSNDFSQGSKNSMFEFILGDITQSLIDFNNSVGRDVGTGFKNITTSIAEFINSMIKVGNVFISSGILSGVNEVTKLYTNLGNLSINTGAITAFSKGFTEFYSTLNAIVTDKNNIDGATKTVKSISDYVSETLNAVKTIGTETNLIPETFRGIRAFFNSFSDIISYVGKKVSVTQANQAMKNLVDSVESLLKGLVPIYGDIISSVINASASSKGKEFFNAIRDFILTINKAIQDALKSFGDGNTTAGVEKIMGIATKLLDALSSVASFIGHHPMLTVNTIIFSKFASISINAIKTISSVIEAMKLLKPSMSSVKGFFGKQIGGNSVGKLLGVGAIGVGANVVNSFVQNSGASDRAKGASGALTNIASSAAVGSMFGGAPGAIMGATVGLIQAVSDEYQKSADRAKEATLKRQKEEENRLRGIDDEWNKLLSSSQIMSQSQKTFLTSQAKNFGRLKDTYDNMIGQIQNTLGTLGENGAIGEAGIKASLDALGYNSTLPVKNISDYYVQMGEAFVSWKDLKKETGINDDKLLWASLNSANVAMGKYSTTIREGVDGIKTTVETFTKAELKRRQGEIKDILDSVTKLGLSTEAIKNKPLEQIIQLNKDLDEVLKTTFKTPEEQKEALSEIILKFDPTAKIVDKSASELRKMAEDINKGIYNSSPEGISSQKEEIIKKLKDMDYFTKEQIKAKTNQTLSEWQSDLAEATQASSDQKADESFIKSALGGIDYSLKGFTRDKINLVSQLLNEAMTKIQSGDEDEAKVPVNTAMEILGVSSQRLKDRLFEQLTNAGGKLMEAGEKANKDYSDLSTDGIANGANNTKDSVGKTLSGAANKLNEASSKAYVNFDIIDLASLLFAKDSFVGSIASIIKGAKDKLNQASDPTGGLLGTLFRSNGGIVPSYKATGGSVSYLNRGGLPLVDWRSRGTDTVPTMLTPGEYVLRKQAVDSLGLGILNKLNTQGARALGNNTTVINNVYNNNNAKITQNNDNKSQWLNGMDGLGRLMRYV